VCILALLRRIWVMPPDWRDLPAAFGCRRGNCCAEGRDFHLFPDSLARRVGAYRSFADTVIEFGVPEYRPEHKSASVEK
jgi:hypothetical protein